MSELLKIVFSLSLSGTMLLFMILALKPLYKNKLSKRWQYYVWLIVVVRMLIPFTPETTLVGSAFAYFDNFNMEITKTAPFSQDKQSDFGVDNNYIVPNAEQQAPNASIDTTTPLSIQVIFSKVYKNLWILWATIAFALLIRKMTMYQSFIRFVKAGQTEVADIKILNMLADVGVTIGVKRPVELFTNPLISSPMLLGFFRPYIILPRIDMENTDLAYIMQHELTHYKHLDMFYKWLVQITVCLHWFNPFAYLLAKEVNKCCELSCDEAIIRKLDEDGKKAYGDTLLNSLKTMGNYNDTLATVTLTEGAEQLKRRLDAIMEFKKKSKAVTAVTLALTAMLCIGATAVGAYAAPNGNKNNMVYSLSASNKIILENGVYYILCDGAEESDKPNSSVTQGTIMFVLVRKDGYTSIGPFNKSNHFVDDVTKQCEYMLDQRFITGNEMNLVVETAANVLSKEKQNTEAKTTREESLVENFALYRSYGLVYNAELDRAFWNAQEVKAFVDLREMFSGGGYSFNLGYIAPDSNSTLYLMAFRDKNGLITGIQEMSKELKDDLYDIYDETSSAEPSTPALVEGVEDNLSEIYEGEYPADGDKYIVFDATTRLNDSTITATDKLNSTEIPKEVAHWISTCQDSDEVNVKKTIEGGKIDAWIYFGSDTRLAWRMNTEGTTLKFVLIDQAPKSISGATLIHYQAPAAYQELEVVYKGEKLKIIVQ